MGGSLLSNPLSWPTVATATAASLQQFQKFAKTTPNLLNVLHVIMRFKLTLPHTISTKTSLTVPMANVESFSIHDGLKQTTRLIQTMLQLLNKKWPSTSDGLPIQFSETVLTLTLSEKCSKKKMSGCQCTSSPKSKQHSMLDLPTFSQSIITTPCLSKQTKTNHTDTRYSHHVNNGKQLDQRGIIWHRGECDEFFGGFINIMIQPNIQFGSRKTASPPLTATKTVTTTVNLTHSMTGSELIISTHTWVKHFEQSLKMAQMLKCTQHGHL